MKRYCSLMLAMTNQNRNSGVELGRIILMSMIVLWHLLLHGLNIRENLQQSSLSSHTIYYIVLPAICCHVNCFVFISGYYGIQADVKKILSFVMTVVVWNVIGFAVWGFLHGTYGIFLLIQSAIPISYDIWWFATLYYFLIIISPIVENGIKFISQRQFIFILSALFLSVASGFAFLSSHWSQTALFFFMYLLGRYIRKYPITFIERNALSVYLLSTLLIALTMIVFRFFPSRFQIIEALDYANPFCISAAVGLFFVFKRINLTNNKAINNIAKGCFVTYLISDGILRIEWNSLIVGIVGHNLLLLSLSAVMATIIISSIDRLRQYVTYPITDFLSNRLEKVIKGLL